MFSALNPSELDIVVNAMQEIHKKKGDVVIEEGDDGYELYVVDNGNLKCTKVLVSCLQRLTDINIERGRSSNIP